MFGTNVPKGAGGWLVEVGHFWLNSRGVVATVASLVIFFIEATNIPQNAQEQRKKPQVQCNTLLILTVIWLACLGEISEQRSLIRETDRDQPSWRKCKRTQRVGRLWFA